MARKITIEFLGNAKPLQSELGDAEGSLSSFGTKLGGLGKLAKVGFAGVATAAAAGGAAIGAALFEAMDQEKATDRLAASLGATPKMAEKYGTAAANLYKGAWGDSMDDVTHAVEAVGSSFRNLGKGKALQDVTAQAMDFSAIFETDIPKSVSVAQTVVKSGLAKDATEAFDLMTAAAQKVPSALREDVMDAAEEYSQFFDSLGYTGPQAFGLLADGAKKGQFGIDKLGDAVKEFTIRSTDGAEATMTTLDILTNGASRKTQDALLSGGKAAGAATQEIIDGLLSIKDPSRQAELALSLFGTPLEDLNVRDIPDFLKSLKSGEKGLEDYEGAIDKAGQTLNDNASTNLESFKRQVTQTFVDVVGGKVLPKVSEFAKTLANDVGPTVQKLGGWFREDLAPAIERMGPSLDKAFAVAKKIFGNVLTIVKDVFPQIKSTFNDAISIIQSLWKAFGKNITTYLATTMKNIKQALGGAFKVIAGLFKTVSSLLKGDWKGVWDGIKQILKGALQLIIGLVKQGFNVVKFAFQNAGVILKAVFSAIWDGIKSLAAKGMEGVVDAVKAIPGKIGALAGKFGEVGRSLIGSFIDGMKNAGGLIADIAGNVWNAVKGLLNSAIGKINSALEFRIGLPLGKSITINPPDIPYLAKGGIVSRPTLAVVGEDGPEAVIPLTARNLPAGIGAGGGGNVIINIHGALDVVATGRQVEKILKVYTRATGRPLQVATIS